MTKHKIWTNNQQIPRVDPIDVKLFALFATLVKNNNNKEAAEVAKQICSDLSDYPESIKTYCGFWLARNTKRNTATYVPNSSWPIEGAVDYCTRKGAIGWAYDPQDPGERFRVLAIDYDNRILGSALCNEYRNDLDGIKDDGRIGFDLKFDRCYVGNRKITFALVNDSQTPPIASAFATISLSPLSHSERDLIARTERDTFRTQSDEHQFFSERGPRYEDTDTLAIAHLKEIMETRRDTTISLIAFYLPQFHTIKENDDNWGTGFTEWRQLARGLPRFPGHYQPRIPRDLGFYSLENGDILQKQIDIAKKHGISAFCYYYYWFNGKKVLHKPLDNHRRSTKSLPFLIMWANENWTKTWDGLEESIILSQDYNIEDEASLIGDIASYLKSRDYFKVNERQLLIIYNPSKIPNCREMLKRWRSEFEAVYGIQPLLYMAQSFGEEDPEKFGFDGAIEFPPHKLSNQLPGRIMPDAYSDKCECRVIDYDDFVEASLREEPSSFPLIKTVVPSWDNDARRPNRSTVLENLNPDNYQKWIRELCIRALRKPILGSSIVAINAWNEWAEAAYLEPDCHYGHAYLNSTTRALLEAYTFFDETLDYTEKKVSAILPCYNHGKFLSERLNSVINQTVKPDEIIFLDDCSQDNSLDIARSFLENSGIPFRIIENTENSGNVFSQWVKGIKNALHEIIWIAETDDSADPSFLERLKPLITDHHSSIAFGNISYIEEDGTPSDALCNYFDGMEYFNWNRSCLISASQAFKHDFSIANIIPNVSGAIFVKPILNEEQVNCLTSFSFAGDWFLYLLASSGGYISYNSDAKSFFRLTNNSASRSAFKSQKHVDEHVRLINLISDHYGFSNNTLDEHFKRLGANTGAESVKIFHEELKRKIRTKKFLNIGIFSYSFDVGGGEVLPVELANALKEAGHHITLIVLKREMYSYQSIRNRLRTDIPVFYMSSIKCCESFISELCFDIVNTHNIGWDYFFFVNDVQLGGGCKWVLSLHGGYEMNQGMLSLEFSNYLRSNVDYWLELASKNSEPLFKANAIADAGNVITVHNAICDSKHTTYDKVDIADLYSIDSASVLLSTCSRALLSKGWETSVSTCLKLRKRFGINASIILIGDGPDLPKLKSKYERFEWVHFIGNHEQPIALMSAVDFMIFPSRYHGESFPMVILESFAANTPVLSRDIGQIKDMVANESYEAGCIAPAHLSDCEISDLYALYIHQVLTNPVAKADLMHSLSMARERFSMESMKGQYLNIFYDALKMN